MKRTVIALLIIQVLVCTLTAQAADYSTVNDESIALFMKVFPEYKAMVEKYGKEAPMEQTVTAMLSHTQELEDLMNAHGTTMAEFAMLLQKITIGYSTARMVQEGAADEANNMFGRIAQLSPISEEEQGVIQRHLPELTQFFEEE